MHPDQGVPEQSMQRDEQLGESLSAQLSEAAEQATFHRRELERWERIGRATAAGLREINAQMPVESTAPDDFFNSAPKSAGSNAVFGNATHVGG